MFITSINGLVSSYTHRVGKFLVTHFYVERSFLVMLVGNLLVTLVGNLLVKQVGNFLVMQVGKISGYTGWQLSGYSEG